MNLRRAGGAALLVVSVAGAVAASADWSHHVSISDAVVFDAIAMAGLLVGFFLFVGRPEALRSASAHSVALQWTAWIALAAIPFLAVAATAGWAPRLSLAAGLVAAIAWTMAAVHGTRAYLLPAALVVAGFLVLALVLFSQWGREVSRLEVMWAYVLPALGGMMLISAAKRARVGAMAAVAA